MSGRQPLLDDGVQAAPARSTSERRLSGPPLCLAETRAIDSATPAGAVAAPRRARWRYPRDTGSVSGQGMVQTGVDQPDAAFDSRNMRIAVLGPLRVDGVEVALGRRDRVVLSALTLRPGVPVTRDRLADALWGGVAACVGRQGAPRVCGAAAAAARRGDDRNGRPRISAGPGQHVDRRRPLRGAGLARARLMALNEPERAAYVLDEALECFAGEPFVELYVLDHRGARGRATDRAPLGAEEARVEALLRAGHHHDVLADALDLVAARPLARAPPRPSGAGAVPSGSPGRGPCDVEGTADPTCHRARGRAECRAGRPRTRYPAPGPRPHGRGAAGSPGELPVAGSRCLRCHGRGGLRGPRRGPRSLPRHPLQTAHPRGGRTVG